ncbi:uncharacterized protein [Diabrotica undecimpunctata]|uniref:uncharacterized protein n=1 Tax=Diabrotica undecimpunctata TaxID=50387 RepID=UPI003B63F6DC
MENIHLVVKIFVLACIILNTAAESPALNKLPYFEECIKLSGATSEDLTPKPDKMTHESKCFFFCAMKKEGAIDATGTYKPEEIFRIMKLYHGIEVPADQIKPISTCLTALGKVTNCDDIIKMHDCLKDYAKA